MHPGCLRIFHGSVKLNRKRIIFPKISFSVYTFPLFTNLALLSMNNLIQIAKKKNTLNDEGTKNGVEYFINLFS